MTTPLPADPARLLADLDALRRFGAVGTGVARRAFSDADVAARRWLAARFEAAGLRAVVDPCGNLFGLPPGDAHAILVGSHSDSQPLGGWLDGAYGVCCGLELARAALESGGPAVAVVSFQDEEGRFGGLVGSAVWSGRTPLAEADSGRDETGLAFAEARVRAAEIATVAEIPPARFAAFVEPHIEQGPALEAAGEALGVVEAIVGVRALDVRFVGEANHAGTTPMPLRRDAFQALAAYAVALNEALAAIAAPATVWTLGRATVEPNAPSIVPGAATVSVQMRDGDAGRLDAMRAAAEATARRVAEARGVGVEIADQRMALQPTPMDPAWIERLARGAEAAVPGRWRRMPSGALHDAMQVAAVLPAAMLFVPSIGGISHNPAEDTRLEHLADGLAALAAALAEA